MQAVEISNDVYVGSPPECEEDVHKLVEDGFQSILSLRLPETKAEFTSRDEGVCATEGGLVFLNCPVSVDDFDEFHVNSFRTKLRLLPKPVFIHAENWKRAAVLGVIDRAVDENWSSHKALEAAEKMGITSEHQTFRKALLKHIKSD